MKKIISKTAVYVVLTFFAVVFAAPLVYAVYYSFTLPENLGTIYPLSEFTTFFYQVLFAKYPVIQWFLNSVVVMLCVVVANVFITIMAGYALARIDFKGRNFIFFIFTSTMMIPDQLLLAPQYVQLVNYGWHNTLISVIVPFLCFPFFVYLSRQFILSIPYELEEAARVDGAGRIYTFFSVILPNTKNLMITIVIICVSWVWNSYLAPATFINDRMKYTLVVGFNTIKDMTFDSVNFRMATVVLLSLPVATVFLVLQKYFIKGIAASGIKG